MRRRALVSGATVVAALLIGSCSTGNPPSRTTSGAPITTSVGPTTTSGPQRGSNAEVTRVVDGDTVEVDFRGRALTVRLIGIDTPESVAPGRAGPVLRDRGVLVHDGPTGGRARAVAVRRRADRSVRPHPRVRVARERAVQRDPGARGLRVRHDLPAERPVRRPLPSRAARGPFGWLEACGDDASTRAPAIPPIRTGCIPPPPPDLDCSDVDERRFAVLPPDPHNFDGDHNGVGCETV